MSAAEALTLLLSAVAVVIAIFKARPEAQASAGDAAESYAAAAKTYSDEVIKLRGELAEIRMQDRDREDRIAKLERENRNLRAWAERLCYQLKSLGVTPVPLCSDAEFAND